MAKRFETSIRLRHDMFRVAKLDTDGNIA